MDRLTDWLAGWLFICQALVNDIHTVQPSLNGINEVGQVLKKEAEPPFAIKIQKLLDDLNSQWELICKQVIISSPNNSSDFVQHKNQKYIH